MLNTKLEGLTRSLNISPKRTVATLPLLDRDKMELVIEILTTEATTRIFREQDGKQCSISTEVDTESLDNTLM